MADDQAAGLAFLDQYRAQIKAASSDPVAFQSYFNRCNSLEQARANGVADFESQILVPQVLRAIGDTATCTALEIGSGGGRLLLAACKHFARVYGVDIHDNQNEVAAFLSASGVNNCELLRTDNGVNIPLPDESADFAYSFIVLMHLRSMDMFGRILMEVARVLRSGAVAHLYYGAADNDSDVMEFHQNGPNQMTLKIGAAKAREAFINAGLSPIGEYRSMYRELDGRYTGYGKQKSIVSVKQ